MADDDDAALRPLDYVCAHLVEKLEPDASRTVLRPFMPEYPRGPGLEPGDRRRVIIERILSVDEDRLSRGLRYVTGLLESRHRNVRAALLRRFEELGDSVPADAVVDDRHRMLIGGFFSLVEVWVEGLFMIEFLDPAQTQIYKQRVTLKNWKMKLAEMGAA